MYTTSLPHNTLLLLDLESDMSQNTSAAVAGLATVLTLLAVGLIVTTAVIILLVLCIRELQQDDNGKRGINNNMKKRQLYIF